MKRLISLVYKINSFYHHYKQKFHAVCVFNKLDEKEKFKLKYQNNIEILTRIERELNVLKESLSRKSKNQTIYLLRHFINFFEYCDILLKAKNYKYLYDYKLAKSYYDKDSLSHRYENSIVILDYILRRYNIGGFKNEYVILNLVHGSNFNPTDETIRMLEVVLNNFKEVLSNEFNNRFN